MSNPFSLLDDEAPSVPKAKVATKVKDTKAKKIAPVVAPKEKTERKSAGPRDSARRGRGRGRGGGGGRGGGRGRDFDRSESGTGRDRGAKKGGHGRGNWGTEDGEGAGAASGGERKIKVVDENGENKEEEPAEPEEVVMGMDEYLASKEAAQEDAGREVRAVEVDESQWEKAVVKAADLDQTADETGKLVIGGTSKKLRKKNKNKKNIISLDQFTAAPAAGKGNNNARGGRGGNGARGGGRGKFNVNSPEAFPSLGK